MSLCKTGRAHCKWHRWQHSFSNRRGPLIRALQGRLRVFNAGWSDDLGCIKGCAAAYPKDGRVRKAARQVGEIIRGATTIVQQRTPKMAGCARPRGRNPRSRTICSTMRPRSSAKVWWLPTNSIGRASGRLLKPRCTLPSAAVEKNTGLVKRRIVVVYDL
jgi:hypothetical protein